MACLRWKPVIATNSSRMRPFSARLPLLYRSMTPATSSSRVAMLTRLITAPPTPPRPGAFQMRQRLNIREQRGGSVALNSRFRRDKWSPAGFRLLRIAAAGWSRPGPASAGQGWSGVSVHCTTRFENAHGTVVREVLYRWHPWFGLDVRVHAAITKSDRVYFRCTLNGTDGARCPNEPVAPSSVLGPRCLILLRGLVWTILPNPQTGVSTEIG